MVCNAGDRTGQDCDQSDREEKLPAPDHVEPLDRDHLSEALRIGHAKLIEGLDNPLGHEERRKHGQENTKRQGFGKALHGACSHNVKNQACDQCCDIAVDDGGQGLAESGVNGGADRIAACNLLADAGIDDDIGIDCHTNRQNDTCNARERQRHVKGIHGNEIQRRVKKEGEGSDNARNLVGNDHDDHDTDDADDTADQGGLQSLLTKLCTDNL